MLVAPLTLARNAIIVTVHLGIWAMLDEEGRLLARSHLRAHGAAITAKGRGRLVGSLGRRWRRVCGVEAGSLSLDWRTARPGLAISNPGKAGDDDKNQDFLHLCRLPSVQGLTPELSRTAKRLRLE